MAAEPTVDRRGMASQWKMAGFLAGGLAVGYALVQERERVAGAVTNVQDTLTSTGLTLMQKLSETADAFLAKVHETLVTAAPPTNLEAAVRHGLTGQSQDAATTSVPRERHRAPRTRLRENNTNTGDENAGDSACESEVSHRRRRTRHTGPEDVTPSQHCFSSAAGAAAHSGSQDSLPAQKAGQDDLMTVEKKTDEAGATTEPTAAATYHTSKKSEAMQETAASLLPEPKETDDTQLAASMAVDDVEAQVATNKLPSAQTTAISQRAQVEPASLLGAQLSATWVDETFTCEVLMIREGNDGSFEALVKYETDGVEQWEVLGEPPYNHILIAEPTDTWLRTGNALIGAHTLERIDSGEFEGVVMAWLPKGDGHESLYKIYHIEDGDFEELDDVEVKVAIERFANSTNGAITKE